MAIGIVDCPIKNGGSFQFAFCMFNRRYMGLFKVDLADFPNQKSTMTGESIVIFHSYVRCLEGRSDEITSKSHYNPIKSP